MSERINTPCPACGNTTPTDPVYAGSFDNCVYGHVDDGILGSVREAALTSRAAAQRYFASELGVDFAKVKCRTTYGRFLTRQEVWDDYGRERASDDLVDDLGLKVKYDPARGDGLDAFWYEDVEGRVVPDSAVEAPAVVPPDWEPNEEDPVWTECKKDAPGAVKIFICEEATDA